MVARETWVLPANGVGTAICALLRRTNNTTFSELMSELALAILVFALPHTNDVSAGEPKRKGRDGYAAIPTYKDLLRDPWSEVHISQASLGIGPADSLQIDANVSTAFDLSPDRLGDHAKPTLS